MIPIGDSPRARHFPWIMVLLVAANVLVFAYELSLGRGLSRWIASVGMTPLELLSGQDLPPPAPGPVAATLFTSMFVHGGFLHLGSNMLYLWVFGDNVEDLLGHLGFLIFYTACGLAGGLTHALVNSSSTVPSIGASGAIAGVLGAYLCMFPSARVRTLVFLGPFVSITRVSAVFVIGLWFVIQLASGLVSLEIATEEAGGVAFWAHIGGFVAGALLALVLRPLLPTRRFGRDRIEWN